MKIITNARRFSWQYGFLMALFLSGIPHQANAQERVLKGVVTSDSLPLMGVSVEIKDSRRGTSTNIDGRYEIKVEPGETIIFSHLGYQTLEVLLHNQSKLDIELQPDALALEAVEITGGYYSLDERTKTGNVTVVGRDQLDQQVIHAPLEALQGRVAGLEVQTRTGLRGQAPKVTLRGQGGLKAFSDYPLYIIDGIPINNEPFTPLSTTYDSAIGIDPLAALDPSLIESIEILKDADATAIYGSRGANGVIIINTKRGQAGKTKLDIQAETGASWVGHFMDLMNTEQYLEMRKEAFANDGVEPTSTNAPDLLLWDQNRYTDWQKELIGHTANFQKYQANISGGNAQTSFLLSGGFEKQGAVFPGEFGFQSNNLLTNLNHRSKDRRFQIYTSINYSYQKNKLFNSGAFILNGLRIAPNSPNIFDSEGHINWELDEFGNPTFFNPLEGIANPNIIRIQFLQWNGNISYQIAKRIFAKINMGINQTNQDDQQIRYKENFNPTFPETVRKTTYNNRLTARNTFLIEPQLEYSFSKHNHQLNILAGATFEKNENKTQSLRGQNYFSDSQANNLALAEEQHIITDQIINYRYAAAFGRIGYSYAQKYHLNLTGRRDGSSRFGKKNRFGNFGAIGAAWEFQKERSVRERFSWLSSGKFRGSYGITGSDNIGDYQYRNAYSNLYVSPGSLSSGGLIPARLYNPYYHWEKNTKLELSLEIGIWENRALFSTGWYRERSGNQLVDLPLPNITGFNKIQGNLAALVQNTGWEFNIQTFPIQTSDFNWNSFINLTIPNNKLVVFPNLESSSYASQYVIGKSLGIQKLYHYTGIDSGTGKYSFEDVNGDGVLNNDDKVIIADLSRKFYGGWNNQLQYRNWNMSFLFEFVNQKGIDPVTAFGVLGSQTNAPKGALNHWKEDSPRSKYQAYTQLSDSGSGVYRSSDAKITSASFTRLKTVSITYNFPEKWLEQLSISQANFYIKAQNLFTITPYKGLDAQNPSGINFPALTSVNVGLKLAI